MRNRAFDSGDLVRLRAVSLREAVPALGLLFRKDTDFSPVKDAATERWYVSVDASVFELLVTGERWFDARAGRGGGGAIDLAMHLLGLDFAPAVKRLLAVGL